MAYIKSKSNYTLQTTHKALDGDAKILERDMATIGGLVRVPNNQVPIYQSGNFILTISQPNRTQREFASSEWVGDGENDFWTLESSSITNSNGEDSTEINLKRDYYKLSDFSYYGSCSELIRSSINHIVSIFPGEIYHTLSYAFVEEQLPYKTDEPTFTINKGYYRLDNPFEIDIHTQYVDLFIASQNSLKYFANDGWSKYEIIVGDKSYTIKEWQVSGTDTAEICIGETSSIKTTLTYNDGQSIEINRLRVSATQYDYIVPTSMTTQFSIRPKKKYLDEFYAKLDNFEKILLDKDSTPKYTAIFEILKETEQGYSTSLEKFTFPTSAGGYNLAVGQALSNGYIDSLVEASSAYDELYCDNLWRSMTHEAIKNFDWTFTKEIDDPSEFIEGGDKVQKLIRLVGREFDEIKSYIDGITSFNTLTYNDIHNAPDYVLSDLVELGGFEVKNIYPFLFKVKKDEETNTPKLLDDVREDINNTIIPYSIALDEVKECSYHTFRQYSSVTEFSSKQVNNYFLKTLKMNIKSILKRKGTIEAIESLLSLFGLKSKRWVDTVPKNTLKNIKPKTISWDFDINEYTVLTSSITDTNNDLDSYNRRKLATYDTLEFRSGIYEPYQGLPIKSYGTALYPYFTKNKPLDGNPYYQMYGGWLRKVGVQYSKNNYIINEGGDNLWFTQTLNRTKVVDNLEDLLALKYDEVENGEIWKVRDISGHYLIVDGLLLPIYVDSRMSKSQENEYIKATVGPNGTLTVGKTIFKGNVTVSDSYKGIEVSFGTYGNVHLNQHNVSLYTPNTEIRIYLINLGNTKSIICQDESTLIENVYYWNNITTTNKDSHYFMLHDKNYKHLLNNAQGWEQLPVDDERQYKYSTIVENYNGNNPHASITNSVYDDGFAYIEMLAQPFKYPLEHDMFYNISDTLGDYWEIFQKLENVKFPHMIIDNENARACTDCIGSYYLNNDKKIHSFGNYYYLSNDMTNVKEFTESNNLTEWFDKAFDTNSTSDSTKSLSYATKTDDTWRNDIYKVGTYSSGITNFIDPSGYTEQIVNTKRVNIDFNIPYEQSDDNAHYATKYINDVVIPYMEQVLPSTIIAHINYRYQNSNG